jgi:hypothetical protein
MTQSLLRLRLQGPDILREADEGEEARDHINNTPPMEIREGKGLEVVGGNVVDGAEEWEV